MKKSNLLLAAFIIFNLTFIIPLQAVMPEEKNKAVNQILLDNIVSGSYELNTMQRSDLQSIAQLCPFQYGSGVYIARAALANYDNDFTHYVNACEIVENIVTSGNGNSGSGKRGEEPTSYPSQEGNIGATVYPNPANNEVINVVLTKIDENYKINNARIEIYAMDGRLLLKEAINTESMKQENISLNLETGIYIYRIIANNDDLIKTERISIIK